MRSEKLLLVRELPAALLDVMDALLATQGYSRLAYREITEDWTPLLDADDANLVLIVSESTDDWTAIFSSLDADTEWELAQAIAISLEQPTAYVAIDEAHDSVAYRYFEQGILREEHLPDQPDFGRQALQERLETHGIPVALLDDRINTFHAPHLALIYARA